MVFNIFELMSAAQGGAGMDALARQFGLSQEQARRTMAALMPAFALGLQRNAADPTGFASLLNMMPGGSAGWDALSPQAKMQGEQALGRLFGPPELTRQVAEQAAHWSGVSAQVVQQMMPIFAAALVGSLAKFSEVMRAQAAPAPSSPPTPDNAAAQPFAAWAEMMRGMMGQAAPQPQKAEAEAKPGAGANPWADMVRAMSGEAPVAPEPSPPASSPPSPEPTAGEAGEDLQAAWSDAIQKGREAQEQYLATLQNIFDKFLGAGAERR